MHTSERGIDFIRDEEGCKLKAYQDSAGVWTIGSGTIIYRTGDRVKKGDVIQPDYAEDLLRWQVGLKEYAVSNLVHPYVVNQNQFDALMSFAYNLGIGALATSTLLKKVRKDASDPAIRTEFLRWCKVKRGGKYIEVEGLKARRNREAIMYFTPVVQTSREVPSRTNGPTAPRPPSTEDSNGGFIELFD